MYLFLYIYFLQFKTNTMKKFDEKTKIGFLIILGGIVFAIAMFFISPIKATNQKEITQTKTSNIIPEDVAVVLRGL